MTYIGLARKWRPQTFHELVGQAAITRTLENAIRLNRVSHALLLTGSRGVGKTTTARILAKALNCEKGPTTEPCGDCSNCREITAGLSVDVLEVDGASNTKVDEIRDLLENVQYRPQKSRHKIYIIDEVHMLSTHSFNALLKTLEEPPPGVIFVFATTEPHKIPETIHSRCQRFDFRQISDEQIARHLAGIVKTESIDVSERALSLIARQAAGSLRDALSLLDQVVAFSDARITDEDVVAVLGLTDRTLIERTLRVFAAGDPTGAMEVVEQVFARGFDPKTYLEEIWGRVRDLVVLKAGADEKVVQATPDERSALKTLVEGIEAPELERWFDLLRHALQEVNRSDFPRYLVEVTFLRIARRAPRIAISELVGRLEALEGRLGPVGTKSAPAPERSVPAAAPLAAPPMPVTKVANPANWEQLVSAVKRRKAPLAAVLLQAAGADVGDGRIVLRFEEGSFYASRAKDVDFQAAVCALAQELFGSAFTMKVETQARAAAVAQPKAAVDRSREKEALENPVVQRAVSLFDARIEEVKPAK